MFYLREITSDGVECNHFLGNYYRLISRTQNPNDLLELFNEVFDKRNSINDFNEELFAIVANDNGGYYTLARGSSWYIVTGNGNTYDNLNRLKSY